MGGRTKLTSVLVALAQRHIEDAGLEAIGSDLTSDGAREIVSHMRGQYGQAKHAAEIAAEAPGKVRRAVKAVRFGASLARALHKAQVIK